MPTNEKRAKWMWGIAGGVCLIALVVVLYPAKAQVTGETAKQRVDSVVRLAGDRSYGAADALARTVANDLDPTVRRAALTCLSAFGRSSDRPVIEAALADEDQSVRRTAAQHLVLMYDDPAAVQRIIEIDQDASSPADQQAALAALGLSRQPEALVRLVQTIESGDPQRRLAAGEALIRRFPMALVPAKLTAEEWRRLLVGIKHITEVEQAYKQTGTALVIDRALEAQLNQEHAEYCHTTGGQDARVDEARSSHAQPEEKLP
ncbi:hypothetical protein LCGC14_0303620 [marine sediment metagenome]|uniref:HEAT repeat domain-containing protein n=1 Tax=marine sediment metagenome TaxID=412755 RepID=A0A0F9U6K3_9ZZZZ|nr:HEAT repeat domain-containing protein [Phycisphaerae bacterium]HDZ44298.1 HEAT repeat domain-containing protein [Phycisphaerae bacterium]